MAKFDGESKMKLAPLVRPKPTKYIQRMSEITYTIEPFTAFNIGEIYLHLREKNTL